MWDVDSPSLDVSERPLRVKNCPQTTSAPSPFSTPSTDMRWTGRTSVSCHERMSSGRRLKVIRGRNILIEIPPEPSEVLMASRAAFKFHAKKNRRIRWRKLHV
jgi:hypothetical protein